MNVDLENLISKFAISVNPSRCYRIDEKGSVFATSMFWFVFVFGFGSLLLCLFKVITGNIAAMTLVLVILSSIAVFNAAKLASEASRKKYFKSF